MQRIFVVRWALLRVGCCQVLLSGLACTGSGGAPRGGIALEMRGADTITREGVTVYYSKGLSRQAECFAGAVAKQLSYIQVTTAAKLPPWFGKPCVYLQSADPVKPTKWPGNYVWELPLFVDPDKTSYEDIIDRNDTEYPHTWAHELIELTLVSGEQPRLLIDGRPERSLGEASSDKVYYTRWFREGFASYCAILACRAVDIDNGGGPDEIRSRMFNKRLYLVPFSSLAKVGTRLFTWTQYDDYADYTQGPDELQGRPPEGSHYDAALALFLIIEDKYGQRAIRDIMQEVNNLENGTGEDVKEIVSRVLGRDIVELVESHRFPYTGLTLASVYRPPAAWTGGILKEGLVAYHVEDNSAAQRAGIVQHDVILSVDGEETLRNFDFEYALYRHMQQESVKVGIWREGAGYMTIEMRLGEDLVPRRRGATAEMTDIRGHHTD